MQETLANLNPPVEAREEVHNDAGLPCRRRHCDSDNALALKMLLNTDA